MAYRAHVLISGEPRCVSKGAREVEAALVDKLHELLLGDEVQVMEVSSLGHGDQGPSWWFILMVSIMSMSPPTMPVLSWKSTCSRGVRLIG